MGVKEFGELPPSRDAGFTVDQISGNGVPVHLENHKMVCRDLQLREKDCEEMRANLEGAKEGFLKKAGEVDVLRSKLAYCNEGKFKDRALTMLAGVGLSASASIFLAGPENWVIGGIVALLSILIVIVVWHSPGVAHSQEERG